MNWLTSEMRLTERAIAGKLCVWGYQPDGSFVPEAEREVWIYFLRGDDQGPVKIGHTRKSPWKRAGDVQVGYPFGVLEVVGLIRGRRSVERELHARFHRLRMLREWFRAEPDLLGFVASLKREAL